MNIGLMFNFLIGFVRSPLILKKTFVSKVFSRIKRKESVWGGKFEPVVLKIEPCFFINKYYSSQYSKDVCAKYMDHCFNFLGTGWTKWNTDNTADKDGYVRIDWCKDIISGYRFTEIKYSSAILDDVYDGTDIKRVWEIGRMNHLPFMSLVAINNDDLFGNILFEIKKQILDISTHSPIGFGAQYYCPMDVGIRCVNILISRDILIAAVPKIIETDEIFQHALDEFVLNQLRYILDNLEYNFADRFGGNHLLCDIASALFICAHYRGRSIDKCYKRLKILFYQSIDKQFLIHGTNFECSSCYHRFTTEMLLVGLISIEIRSSQNEGDRFIEAIKKLDQAKALLELLTGTDGNITQIGDNDSGFILKICPEYRGDVENTLKTDFLIGGINAFIWKNNEEKSVKSQIGFNLVRAYQNKKIAPLVENKKDNIKKALGDDSLMDISKIEALMAGVSYKETTMYSTSELGRLANINKNEEFGIIRLQYEQGEIFIRSAVDYRKMFLGHAHDDIFHFEIVTSNGRRYADCGSIYYTGNPYVRFKYSGAEGHNTVIHHTPLLNRKEMFEAESSCTVFTRINKNIIYIVAKNSYIHIRKFDIKDGYIEVTDASDEKFQINRKGYEYSYGYGNFVEDGML